MKIPFASLTLTSQEALKATKTECVFGPEMQEPSPPPRLVIFTDQRDSCINLQLEDSKTIYCLYKDNSVQTENSTWPTVPKFLTAFEQLKVFLNL